MCGCVKGSHKMEVRLRTLYWSLMAGVMLKMIGLGCGYTNVPAKPMKPAMPGQPYSFVTLLDESWKSVTGSIGTRHYTALRREFRCEKIIVPSNTSPDTRRGLCMSRSLSELPYLNQLVTIQSSGIQSLFNWTIPEIDQSFTGITFVTIFYDLKKPEHFVFQTISSCPHPAKEGSSYNMSVKVHIPFVFEWQQSSPGLPDCRTVMSCVHLGRDHLECTHDLNDWMIFIVKQQDLVDHMTRVTLFISNVTRSMHHTMWQWFAGMDLTRVSAREIRGCFLEVQDRSPAPPGPNEDNSDDKSASSLPTTGVVVTAVIGVVVVASFVVIVVIKRRGIVTGCIGHEEAKPPVLATRTDVSHTSNIEQREEAENVYLVVLPDPDVQLSQKNKKGKEEKTNQRHHQQLQQHQLQRQSHHQTSTSSHRSEISTNYYETLDTYDIQEPLQSRAMLHNASQKASMETVTPEASCHLYDSTSWQDGQETDARHLYAKCISLQHEDEPNEANSYIDDDGYEIAMKPRTQNSENF